MTDTDRKMLAESWEKSVAIAVFPMPSELPGLPPVAVKCETYANAQVIRRARRLVMLRRLARELLEIVHA